MEYLSPSPKPRRFIGKILFGLLILLVYVIWGDSTNPQNMEEYVQKRVTQGVVRYEVYDQSLHGKIVMVRDDQDGRTALAFVKIPFLNRWHLTEKVTVDGEIKKPIVIGLDDGFTVYEAEVSFDRVKIIGVTHWSGSYAKIISILLFLVLAVFIYLWMEWKKQPRE